MKIRKTAISIAIAASLSAAAHAQNDPAVVDDPAMTDPGQTQSTPGGHLQGGLQGNANAGSNGDTPRADGSVAAQGSADATTPDAPTGPNSVANDQQVPGRQLPGQQDPSQSAALSGSMRDRFSAIDRNGDASIDRAEANASAGLSGDFSTADENQDGRVSEGEFAAFVEVQGDSMRRNPGDEDE